MRPPRTRSVNSEPHLTNLAAAENGRARPVQYHTLAEYAREVADSAVVFRPVSESSYGSLPIHHPTPTPSTIPPSDILFLPKRLAKLW
ncbi:hypothetical protein EVAR_53131_1 [Eumeta japonica]|uniref:Uncharacterized protein n=1 Tax=Eumeta variegata TaxID=151549 RepID=A0A4C1YB82_EUMVA|nr:hypothetical protein EVAR_53131_1 [Eumeta japonica]